MIARKTVLTLICLIGCAVVVGYLIPQRFTTTPPELEGWRQAHTILTPWVDRLGLDHLYTSLWFAVPLAVFLLSLLVSTVDQFRFVLRKSLSMNAVSSGRSFGCPAAQAEAVIEAIKTEGYLRIAAGSGCIKLVKYPWGQWGNLLLHLGIVLTIASSLLIVLTQQRGVITLVEGEHFASGGAWTIEDNGMLASRLILPEALRVDRIKQEFWETDDLKQLTTSFRFIDGQAAVHPFTISINRMLNYKGVQVYQKDAGNAFFLEFTAPDGSMVRRIYQIPMPSRRDQARYESFNTTDLPYTIKAKYFADAAKKTMVSNDPLLVLRFVDNGRVRGEASLRVGESRPLAEYTVKLLGTKQWVGLIFVAIYGMPGIYLAFFMAILGGAFSYFTPSREFIVKTEGELVSVIWRGTRFEELYCEEYERVATRMRPNSEEGAGHGT